MAAHDHTDAESFDRHDEDTNRVTAPMQSFTRQQAITGGLILLVGLLVSFGLPLIAL